MLRPMDVIAPRLLSVILLLALTGCTHGERSKPAAASSETAAPASASSQCAGTPPMREGPAVLAVMRKSQRDGMYPYIRLSRGQQVQALVPSGVQHFTVKLTGDVGVLTPLGRQSSAKGGTLLR